MSGYGMMGILVIVVVSLWIPDLEIESPVLCWLGGADWT